MTMSAQSVFDIKLYNGRPPYNNGDESDSAKVRVFLPAEKQATGRAIVICPGGAYETLSMEKKATIGANSSRTRVLQPSY